MWQNELEKEQELVKTFGGEWIFLNAHPHYQFFDVESDLTKLLLPEIQQLFRDGTMTIEGKVAESTEFRPRSDSIIWYHPTGNLNSMLNRYHILMHRFMNHVNSQLLGGTEKRLTKIEMQLSKYPAGSSGFKYHFDATKISSSSRRITFVFYLNSDWKKEDGGEIEIALNSNSKDTVSIEPIANRFLIFHSCFVKHRVLSNNNDRYSITCWFS